MVRVGCVEQSVVLGVASRENRVCRSHIHRCVKGEEQRTRANDLWSQTFRWDAQLTDSAARRPKEDLHAQDCDGCNAAQVDAEVKLHSEGCQERIRQALMSDDMGQQKLHERKQRRAVTGGQVSSAPRVETSQGSQDVKVTRQRWRQC